MFTFYHEIDNYPVIFSVFCLLDVKSLSFTFICCTNDILELIYSKEHLFFLVIVATELRT